MCFISEGGIAIRLTRVIWLPQESGGQLTLPREFTAAGIEIDLRAAFQSTALVPLAVPALVPNLY